MEKALTSLNKRIIYLRITFFLLFIIVVFTNCKISVSPETTTVIGDVAIEEKKTIHKRIHKELPLKQGQTEYLVNEISIPTTSDGDSLYTDVNYDAVYIDNNRKSEVYDDLINTDKDEFFTTSTDYIKHKLPNLGNLPRKWISLTPYHGEYYIYASLIASPVYIELTDSLFYMYRTAEGDYGLSYSDIKQDKNKYSIENLTNNANDFFIKSVKISILNKNKGIALFEYTYGEDDTRSELYVDINKMRDYSLIMQYSSSGMIMKPNYYPIEPQNLDSIIQALKRQ